MDGDSFLAFLEALDRLSTWRVVVLVLVWELVVRPPTQWMAHRCYLGLRKLFLRRRP